MHIYVCIQCIDSWLDKSRLCPIDKLDVINEQPRHIQQLQDAEPITIT